MSSARLASRGHRAVYAIGRSEAMTGSRSVALRDWDVRGKGVDMPDDRRVVVRRSRRSVSISKWHIRSRGKIRRHRDVASASSWPACCCSAASQASLVLCNPRRRCTSRRHASAAASAASTCSAASASTSSAASASASASTSTHSVRPEATAPLREDWRRTARCVTRADGGGGTRGVTRGVTRGGTRRLTRSDGRSLGGKV